VRRGIAFIFDILVILGIYFLSVMILIFIIITVAWQPTNNFNANGVMIVGAGLWLLLIFSVITISISMIYFVVAEVKFGGTIGKKLMSLRVVPTEGTMNITKGIIRNLAKICGILIGCILGSFIIVFVGIIGLLILDVFLGMDATMDPRQKYTDKMASTTVIRTDIEENIEDLRYIPPAPALVTQDTGTQATSTIYSGGADTDSLKGHSLTDTESDIVKEYSNFFGISEARALDLYNAGYKHFKDIKDAIVEDLIMVNEINPTVARKIIKKISSEPLPTD
jgi:hypothetical protein